jgi:hypothetical protein
MAVVGHWANLAEAQKLTQSVLLSGVIDTVIQEGQLLPMMGVKMLKGKSLLYNREKSFTASTASNFRSIHEQIPWTADVEYNQIEVALKIISEARAVDKFISATYSNINDYEATVMQEVIKRVIYFAEDKLIYGDATYTSSKEFDGLHAINAGLETTTASGETAEDKVNIDGGEAVLSLVALRRLLDACRVDQIGRNNVAILMGPLLARRIDQGYQEAAFVRSSVTHSMASYSIGARELGGRVTFFDGVPIIRTNFLVAEQANTGTGSSSDARAKYSSSTRNYSLFVVRFGNTEDGGLEMLFGDPGVNDGEFKPFFHERFDKLEDYLAGGHRISGFMAPALGAPQGLGRMYDIIDGAIVP